jgi:hypothetical protein
VEDLIGLARRACWRGISRLICRDILRGIPCVIWRDISSVGSRGIPGGIPSVMFLTMQHSHAVIPGEAFQAEERAIRR